MTKVLLIQTASLGDVILATATAHSVRTLLPDAKIYFLVKSACADVLADNPLIDHLIIWDKKSRKYRNLLKILKQIRAERFDVVINFQRFFSSGFVTAFSRGKIKAGFSNNPLSFLFNKKVKHRLSGLHEIQRNLCLAATCFNDLTEEKPFIATKEPAIAEIKDFTSGQFITVFPGSLWPTKQFPVSGWVDFMKAVPAYLGVIFLGSDADKALAESIMEARPGDSYNLCGRLNVLQSAWIMKMAMMNFSNDSAPTHMASAVNAPVATIFCSTVPAFGFTPLSDKSYIIECREKLSCRPCGVHGHKTCPEKHFNCGHKIETTQLTELL